tara:strand:- start:5627 stop:5848 length:222 start_codon:yes stop_codon:yes gene_type:complete
LGLAKIDIHTLTRLVPQWAGPFDELSQQKRNTTRRSRYRRALGSAKQASPSAAFNASERLQQRENDEFKVIPL